MPLVRVGRFRLILQSVSELQSNKPRCGGARVSGSRFVSTKLVFLSRWLRIFSMTTGSSMQAITRSAPPQARQVSTSMLKTRRRRWAQVIEARRLATGRSFAGSITRGMLPLPRFAGVTWARWRLLGANTPWYRVRLTRGLGTSAESLAMKSTGSTESPGAILNSRRLARRAEGRMLGVT